MSRQVDFVSETDFSPLLHLDMDVSVFASDWLHCDRVSSYIARMVSHNRTDSLLYANLLSSALNELLEIVFRLHRSAPGEMSCRILRRGQTDRIELLVPCDAESLSFISSAVESLRNNDVADRYHSALFAAGPLDPHIGLLELAVDYGARIEVRPLKDGKIALSTELNLEGGTDRA